MNEHAPPPQSTLAILLGASEWPDYSDFPGSKAFANVASSVRGYLLNPQQFGLSKENFLDLFDTDQGPDKIDRAIRDFLKQRTAVMRQAVKTPKDLLFYFVGHGGFVGRNSDYFLAVRCTSSDNPGVSGIRADSLATTLTDKARYLRRLIILDCCYAAAAFTSFQAEGPAQVAARQTADVFREKRHMVGKGTSLLCSSGKKVTSLLTPDGSSTMFSKALLQVLTTTGNPLSTRRGVFISS
ncbi:MAG TPA: caspase family protein [Ktedonobacteraceae bacterium]|nr:caspase family protein [Ktedonobacteraceae bacterium]